MLGVSDSRRFPLNEGLLAETAASHQLEQSRPGRPLAVVDELHLPHQAGIRGLEPLGTLEHLREPHHTALAADARDLDRLRRHDSKPSDLVTRSAAASNAE